jgi:hypothetical protein
MVASLPPIFFYHRAFTVPIEFRSFTTSKPVGNGKLSKRDGDTNWFSISFGMENG